MIGHELYERLAAELTRLCRHAQAENQGVIMSTIFCDNNECVFSDGHESCDCDKLSIVGGVCEGSVHGGRNASDSDIDEQLKTENKKLRELVRIAIEYCVNGYCSKEDKCPLYESRHSCKLCAKARELGIEVEYDKN